MRALVIYESMFGDNQQVARAIASGLTEAGVEADPIEVGAAPTVIPGDVDLLVVGSPNHAWSMPRPSTRRDAAGRADGPLVSQGIGVREWLASVTIPRSVRAAAYDTRGSHPRAVVALDHASASIEKGLARHGCVALDHAEHFLVADMKGPLEPGEVDRARAWGRDLGHRLSH